jgi:hypothetical protein
MNIINNNPYRQLGVYSTSPQREVVANQGKMKAFLKVGRPVTFPLDLNGLLPDVLRTEQSVADAISKLTLPTEQLRYAQFWFSKCTQLDEIACGKLTSGDIAGAVEIWNKKATASSLQNLLLCALIQNQLKNAISYAQTLYSSYNNEFVKMILGDNALATSDNLAHDFLNVMCEEFNPNQFLCYITNSEWKEYVGSKSTKPIIDKLASAIDLCKSSKGKGATARLNAGTKLMDDTKADLAQLKQFVSTSDLQYQMIADKLGLEILQCGIDYYNDSDAAEAAHKAMVLQKYAQSIVVGKMAKDRCKENVDILTKIIAELPPTDVFAEDKAIKGKLVNISKQANTISNAVSLLNGTRDDLVSIKNKLGASSAYYLKLSTIVVNCALGFVIEEVNRAQSKIISFEDFQSQMYEDPIFGSILGRRSSSYSSLYTSSRYGLGGLDSSTYNAWVKLHNSQVDSFKNVAQSAWNAIKLMDKFDLEADFKTKRYDENRRILKGLCDKLGISTSTWSGGSGSGSGCMVVIAIVVTLGILVSCL